MSAPDILAAIPSTEPCSFGEFLSALGDDRPEYPELFRELETLQSMGLVEIERSFNNRIDTMQLTEAGAEMVREQRRKR